MQFFVVALLVAGAMASLDPNDPQNKARAMMAERILTADPSTMVGCKNDDDCTAKPGWKCQDLMKLCAPGNSPKTEALEGECPSGEHKDCRPLYNCNKDKKCAFVGPRSCESEADCNANVEGTTFECTERPTNAPGKRCWRKCTKDQECWGCKADGTECRIPEKFQAKMGCSENVCQRKMTTA